MLIQIYQFLHEHHDSREDWKFIHYFVYNLTFFLVAACGIAGLGGLGFSLILVLIQNPAWSTVLKITGGCAICAIICWSLMDWISHE